MLFLNESREVLVKNADRYFWSLVTSSIILLIGVLMEEFHPLDRFPTHNANTRTRTRTPRTWVIRSQKWYRRLAIIFVVLGIAGEGIFEYLSAETEGKIRNIDNAATLKAKEDATQAQTEALKAKISAEDAAKAADQLKATAALLQKSLYLQGPRRDRLLARRAWFSALLKPFAGQKKPSCIAMLCRA